MFEIIIKSAPRVCVVRHLITAKYARFSCNAAVMEYDKHAPVGMILAY